MGRGGLFAALSRTFRVANRAMLDQRTDGLPACMTPAACQNAMRLLFTLAQQLEHPPIAHNVCFTSASDNGLAWRHNGSDFL